MLTPEERTLRARIAAHALHAKHDSSQLAATARAGLLAKFEAQVDPDGTLPPKERHRRAEHLRKAHYARLALQSARSRREKSARSKRKGKEEAAEGESAAGVEA